MQQDVSKVSKSQGAATEESSDAWEEASDQTEADEEEAEEAREALYGPSRNVMKGDEPSSPQFIFERDEYRV